MGSTLSDRERKRCPEEGTLLCKASLLLDGSLHSTALRQQHPDPFPQQTSPGHGPSVALGAQRCPTLHGAERSLCAAANLQGHPHLRGLSEDNTLTNMKRSSNGSPPCPEHLAVLKVSSVISGRREKKISSAVLSHVFAATCPFAKNKQNSFHRMQQTRVSLLTAPVPFQAALCIGGSAFLAVLQAMTQSLGIEIYPCFIHSQLPSFILCSHMLHPHSEKGQEDQTTLV